MPDSLPVPPGGERQDPCEWTILHCGVDVQAGNAIVHGPDVPAESPVRVVEASSVPVGAAPRLVEFPDGHYETEAQVRGAPRDDQNDDGYALPTYDPDKEVAVPFTWDGLVGTVEAILDEWYPEAVFTGESGDKGAVFVAALYQALHDLRGQTRERSASASTKPSSGSAPKGEQEALKAMTAARDLSKQQTADVSERLLAQVAEARAEAEEADLRARYWITRWKDACEGKSSDPPDQFDEKGHCRLCGQHSLAESDVEELHALLTKVENERDELRKAVEPGPLRAASSNPSEARIEVLRYLFRRLRSLLEGALKTATDERIKQALALLDAYGEPSPPPDRLTPEDVESEELWRALMDEIGVQHANAAVKVLMARLSDREPE